MSDTHIEGRSSKFADIGTVTQEQLKAIFTYDPDTGIFTRNGKHRYPVAGTMKNGYVRMSIKRKCYAAHRLAWLYVHGSFPKDTIDHINGIKTDNRIQNLREATEAENVHCRKLTKSNTSGFKGVSFSKQYGNWVAAIRHNKKTVRIGVFDDPQIAAHAYNKAAMAIYGEFACLNPIGA